MKTRTANPRAAVGEPVGRTDLVLAAAGTIGAAVALLTLFGWPIALLALSAAAIALAMVI